MVLLTALACRQTGGMTTELAADTQMPTSALQATALPTAATTSRYDGAWLVFPAAMRQADLSPWDLTYTLWGVHADGSGLTQLNELPLYLGSGDVLDLSVSPDGRHLATFTARDSWHGLALVLYSLPDFRVETLTPLVSAQMELPATPWDIDSHDMRFTVWEALAVSSPAWSPDGKWLAFTSAHGGPSIDLYVYSMENGSITRLSEEPFHAYGPFWSLDSQTIVFGELEYLGVGPTMDEVTPVPASVGVYAAAVDGSGVRRLYDAPNSYGDEFIGWTGPSTFAVFQSIFNSGPANLRVVDIETGEVAVLAPGYLSGVSLDPVSGTLVYSAQLAFNENAQVVFEGGSFMLKGGSTVPEMLPNSVRDLFWLSAQGVFVAAGEPGTSSITLDGVMAPLEAPMGWHQLAPAPIGDGIAWYDFDDNQPGLDSGIWIGDFGSQPAMIAPDDVRAAVWSPDGQGLFTMTKYHVNDEDQLYCIHLSDGNIERIAEDLTLMVMSTPVWLGD
jgi:WD40 repeat protein